MPGPQITTLADGRRLHLHHGPIDLILSAEGPGRGPALDAACTRFGTVLDELVGELDRLRRPVGPAEAASAPKGRIARAMHTAVLPHAPAVMTPMAAVAGAVADEILRVMTHAGPLRRAYVNNGGDVALHLAPGQSMTAALASGSAGRVTIEAGMPVRGVASSGWRGRSLSLGIADAVTVLAGTAAQADAAATRIANAVDLPGSPKVARCAARDLSPDSDLGSRLVTTGVAPLTDREAAAALARGLHLARALHARGLIFAAHLSLAGHAAATGAAFPPKELSHA